MNHKFYWNVSNYQRIGFCCNVVGRPWNVESNYHISCSIHFVFLCHIFSNKKVWQVSQIKNANVSFLVMKQLYMKRKMMLPRFLQLIYIVARPALGCQHVTDGFIRLLVLCVQCIYSHICEVHWRWWSWWFFPSLHIITRRWWRCWGIRRWCWHWGIWGIWR